MQETEPHKMGKLFPNGGSKAVRLPKAFLAEGVEEVLITKQGDRIILEPHPAKQEKLSWKAFWEDYFKNAPLLDDDFHIERDRSPPRPLPDLF